MLNFLKDAAIFLTFTVGIVFWITVLLIVLFSIGGFILNVLL